MRGVVVGDARHAQWDGNAQSFWPNPTDPRALAWGGRLWQCWSTPFQQHRMSRLADAGGPELGPPARRYSLGCVRLGVAPRNSRLGTFRLGGRHLSRRTPGIDDAKCLRKARYVFFCLLIQTSTQTDPCQTFPSNQSPTGSSRQSHPSSRPSRQRSSWRRWFGPSKTWPCRWPATQRCHPPARACPC